MFISYDYEIMHFIAFYAKMNSVTSKKAMRFFVADTVAKIANLQL